MVLHEFRIVITNINDKKDSRSYHYTASSDGYLNAVIEATDHAIKLLGLYSMQYYIQSITSLK